MKASFISSTGKNISGLVVPTGWCLPNMRRGIAVMLGEDVEGENWFLYVRRPFGRYVEHIHMPNGATRWEEGETLHRYWLKEV